MLTELCLASDEFDHFAVQVHSSITFCLKELRVRQWTKQGITEQKNSRISQNRKEWKIDGRERSTLKERSFCRHLNISRDHSTEIIPPSVSPPCADGVRWYSPEHQLERCGHTEGGDEPTG